MLTQVHRATLLLAGDRRYGPGHTRLTVTESAGALAVTMQVRIVGSDTAISTRRDIRKR